METLIPLVYLLYALIQLPPVIFMHRFANRIGRLLATRSSGDLAEALEAQKSFWRYVGILALVVMSLAILGFIAAVGFAARLGASHRF